jgi:two-component system CheB/CheR fusion protein
MISHSKPGRPLVVGVGASAGGLEALQAFFRAIPAGNGLIFVVVSHLDPNAKTFLPEILAKSALLSVEEAKDGQRLLQDTVYVAPGHSLIAVAGGVIHLTQALRREDRRAPIDRFFQSLARDRGPHCAAIVLSGAGSDGALGLKAVSDAGGLTFVQEPSTARHHGMPQSALDSGVADFTLPPVEMARELLAHVRHLATIEGEDEEAIRQEVLSVLPEVCEKLLRVSGHNFSHYKPTTLTRRILRRIQVLRSPSVRDYLDLLETDPAEPSKLFKEFLINVTAFFRDPDAFDVLARQILPRFFKDLQEGDNVRIWVPGCSTGEEAYTLAILLREQMDSLATPPEVQIFATDIDEEALATARQGLYPLAIAEQISPERLARFFVKKGQQYQIAKEVRDLVLFSLHNLTNDPPFSRLDLISCRNLLIYLGTYLQKKLIPLFHYALRPGGHLFLGPSENLNAYRDLFRTVDAKHRISVRLPTNSRISGLLSGRTGPSSLVRSPSVSPATDVDTYFLMERNTLQKYAPRTVVADEEGHLICSSGNLDKYLALAAGAYYNSVIRLAREGLRMGIRSALAEAVKTKKLVTRDGLSLKTDLGMQRVAITVEPLPLSGDDSGLYYIAFQDLGPPFAVEGVGHGPTAEDAANIIEQLERELVSTRQDLERTVQDLEAANEELKSGNEELLSMNEELETSKDEVQSANEGLARANKDLENLLASTQIATLFLDSDGYLRSTTAAAAEIYNVRPVDTGRPLADFTHRALAMPPMPSFADVCRSKRPFEDEVEMQNGTWYLRRVLPYRNHQGDPEGTVVTFVDITARRQGEQALRDSEARFRQLADSMPQMVWTARPDGPIDYLNKRCHEFIGAQITEDQTETLESILHPEDKPAYQAVWNNSVRTGEPFQFESRFADRHTSTYRWHLSRALPVRDEIGQIATWYGTATDIDDQKRIEGELRASEERFRLTADFAPVLIWLAGPESTRNWFNKPWIEFVGRPIEVLVDNRWTDDLHPDDADQVTAEYATAFDKRVPFTITYRLRRHDDTYRWILDTGVPRFLPDGEFVGYIGSCVDITDQKRA